jgi:hypothetical protein
MFLIYTVCVSDQRTKNKAVTHIQAAEHVGKIIFGHFINEIANIGNERCLFREWLASLSLTFICSLYLKTKVKDERTYAYIYRCRMVCHHRRMTCCGHFQKSLCRLEDLKLRLHLV